MNLHQGKVFKNNDEQALYKAVISGISLCFAQKQIWYHNTCLHKCIFALPCAAPNAFSRLAQNWKDIALG